MLKSLSNGFLHTIGKIIAYIFVGLVIGTLLYKFPTNDSSSNWLEEVFK